MGGTRDEGRWTLVKGLFIGYRLGKPKTKVLLGLILSQVPSRNPGEKKRRKTDR